MVHSICETDTQRDTVAYLSDLVTTLLEPGELRTKLQTVFGAETSEFDLPYAFLTRVDPVADVQHIQIACGTHDRLQPGESAPLSESYCRKTLASDDEVLCVNDALAEGWADDPAYQAFELGSYVGAVVEVDGEVYGTLCFASSEPRSDPITEWEVALVEILAAWVGYELSRWGASARHIPGGETDLEDLLLAPEMSRLVSALAAPERRLILLYLSEGMPVTEDSLVSAAADMTSLKSELRHKHLPKLAELEYIDWDKETGEISKGPQFDRIEPFFDMLADPGIQSSLAGD